MASRHLTLRIASWTVFIGLSAALGALAWSIRPHPLTIILFVALLFIEVLLFARDMNRMNRRIASFLQALGNQDTALHIPEETGSALTREISGALNRVIASFREVQLEYAAREQRYLAMIEHSSTGFISIDRHGDFEIMNEAARKLLGVRFTSNLSRIQQHMPALYHLIDTIEPGQQRTCKINGPDGSLVLQVSSSGMIYKGEEYRLLSMQDIRHEADARELESWQKLIRIMNHEIMNSIAPITSASRSLRALFYRDGHPVGPGEVDTEIIADTLDGLEIIASMSEGLKHFVKNYRKLSSVPDPVLRTLHPDKWAGTLRKLGREIASHSKASFEIAAQPGIPELHVDEGLMNQVMINLIRNAAEAPGGEDPKAIRVEIGAEKQEGHHIRVINNGQPIPPDQADTIFIPFYTTKDRGAGIGLFLSRQVAIKHGGTLSTRTGSDGNTIFELKL